MENLKLFPASKIELWETANLVYNFEQKSNASAQLWWQMWQSFPLNLSFMQFPHKISFYLFYTMMAKKSYQGGGNTALGWV